MHRRPSRLVQNRPPPAAPPYDLFTLHLEVPHGARIDYLRLFFYDTSSANSQSWITTYNAQGAFSDLTSVDSVGTGGYGTNLSVYLGHVVDTETNAYVLNWRPNQLGSAMRLCGLRVAYRLPVGAGWSNFYYFFAAGSTIQPRDSGTTWEYDGVGCHLRTLPDLPAAHHEAIECKLWARWPTSCEGFQPALWEPSSYAAKSSWGWTLDWTWPQYSCLDHFDSLPHSVICYA